MSTNEREPSDSFRGGVSDSDVAFLLELLREYWSLPAQRQAIKDATAYELVRARRLLHIVLGCFGRPGSGRVEEWRAAAITFGKPLIPLFLRLLRGPHAGRIVRVLLSISLVMRGRISKSEAVLTARVWA